MSRDEHIDDVLRRLAANPADPYLSAVLAGIVAVLREDAARIDWLDARARADGEMSIGRADADADYDEWAGRSYNWPATYWCGAPDAQHETQPFDSLRAAIDAAMQAGEPAR